MSQKTGFYIFSHLERQGIFLNPQQKEAVEAIEGPVLLLAVPGAGKTTVLVSRIANMMGRGIPPSQILTLTFNREAAADMAARFNRLFSGVFLDSPRFSTIHSFCYQVLREYAKSRGTQLPVLIESTGQKAALLGELYRAASGELMTEDIFEQLSQAIGYVKNMMIPKGSMDAGVCEIKEFPQVYQAYEEKKREYGFFDYDDMLSYALTALRRYPQLRRIFTDRYRYFNVDEAQDTSKLQHAILQLFAAERGNLFLVGDEDQSIYRFRGAYPQALLDFPKQFPGCRILKLEENYRSTKEIVARAAQFIKLNRERYDKQMYTNRGKGKPVKLTVLEDIGKQYRYLLRRIRKLPPGRTMAVLFRTNDSGIPFLDLMDREGMDFYIREHKASFAKNFIVEDILNFARLSVDPTDVDAFGRVYYRMKGYISRETAGFVKANCRRREDVFELLLLAQDGEQKNTARIQYLRHIVSQLKDVPPGKMIGLILDELGYQDYLAYRCKKGYQLEVAMQKMGALRSVADQCRDLESFLNRLESLDDIIKLHSGAGQRACPVMISTVHSSKGMEFDEVIVVDLIEGHFPSAQSIEEYQSGSPALFEEEARLFYVAVTRAKDILEIVTADKSGEQTISRSRFIPRLFVSGGAKGEPQRACGFQEGDRVSHAFFGDGILEKLDLNAGNAKVFFEKFGEKTLSLALCVNKKIFWKLS